LIGLLLATGCTNQIGTTSNLSSLNEYNFQTEKDINYLKINDIVEFKLLNSESKVLSNYSIQSSFEKINLIDNTHFLIMNQGNETINFIIDESKVLSVDLNIVPPDTSYYFIVPPCTPSLSVGVGFNLSVLHKGSEYLGKLNWESLNDDIATIDNGYIFGLQTGEVHIRATIPETEIYFQSSFTVLSSETLLRARTC
jgi:hypothetical protein